MNPTLETVYWRTLYTERERNKLYSTGTGMEQERNKNGTRTEQERNKNGTGTEHFGRNK